MGNVFDISKLGSMAAAAKDKALAEIGDYGLNEMLGGRVLPPLPVFPRPGDEQMAVPGSYDGDNTLAQGSESERNSLYGVPMMFPLALKLPSESEWWYLPMEPIISLSGGNAVKKRSVAKMPSNMNQRRGTIKEGWAQDDYRISIVGLFTTKDGLAYPESDVKKLRALLEAREPIEVQCQLFEYFGIGRMVVDSWDMPFTKGEENQAFTISASSDDDWDLLLPLKK